MEKARNYCLEISFSLLLLTFQSYAALNEVNDSVAQNDYRIMFYNVENLFDPFHDTLKNDYEFVTGGTRGWNWNKFIKKIQNISKVVITSGGWQPPEIVAFSEVENRFVITQMLKRTPLERFDYRIIHEESPDERGIDVAMIYRPDKFREFEHKPININLPDSIKTRCILYVKGQFIDEETGLHSDTIHLFINHWPSRTGGPAQTMHRREKAALTLRHQIDSLTSLNPDSHIILTGDFNDEPIDESVQIHLGAEKDTSVFGADLYNLMTKYLNLYDTGTNKFRNQWGLIDMFIVSESLIRDSSESSFPKLKVKSAEILRFPFLMQTDEKYSGTVPYRTFHGMQYQGGFSDHLPILLTLSLYD